MKMRIYLSGQQYIEHEANSKELNRILAEYDNTEKTRIMIMEDFVFWYLAKKHIIAIQVEPRLGSPTKH